MIYYYVYVKVYIIIIIICIKRISVDERVKERERARRRPVPISMDALTENLTLTLVRRWRPFYRNAHTRGRAHGAHTLNTNTHALTHTHTRTGERRNNRRTPIRGGGYLSGRDRGRTGRWETPPSDAVILRHTRK